MEHIQQRHGRQGHRCGVAIGAAVAVAVVWDGQGRARVPGGRGLGLGRQLGRACMVGREEASHLGLGGGDRGSERADLAGPWLLRGPWSGDGELAGPRGCEVEGEGMEPKRQKKKGFLFMDKGIGIKFKGFLKRGLRGEFWEEFKRIQRSLRHTPTKRLRKDSLRLLR